MLETSWPFMTATEINLGFAKSFPLKHSFTNQTLRSGFLCDLWVSHLRYLRLHSHIHAGPDSDFFLQASQRSFICSKKVTSVGLETTRPVFKINIISFLKIPHFQSMLCPGKKMAEKLIYCTQSSSKNYSWRAPYFSNNM